MQALTPRPINYENLARAYHQSGQLAKAVRAMEKVCEVSVNPRTRYLMAIYYYEYGDSPSAEAMLHEILVQRPAYQDVRDDLIEILFYEKRFDEVVEQADAGLVHHPEYGRFYYYKGMSLARMGQLDAGEAACAHHDQVCGEARRFVEDRARRIFHDDSAVDRDS